jgi:type II secretory pathway component PulK
VTFSPKSAPRAEAGFVLVAVLWILAALATLASIYSSYTVNTAAASHVADDRVQAEASIRAGVEMAVYRQLALPEKARPVRGGFDMRVGRTGVAVRFRSEGARIDLNAAPADLLAGLFTAVGVDSSRAETFSDRIVGWRTKAAAGAGANAGGADANATVAGGNAASANANAAAGGANTASANANAAGSDANAAGSDANAAGANANPAGAGGAEDKAAQEDQLYSEQHMPYPPRHAPFDNALELSLLPGISLAVVQRVLPYVTVFSGRADVDVSSADPTVLSALPQMTPEILGAVLNARVSDPGDGRALLELLGPAKSRATTDTSRAFRASIVVDFDNGRHVHAEVVFRLEDQGDKGQGGKDQGPTDQSAKDQSAKDRDANERGADDQSSEPYELLYWRDDFDGPLQSA